MPRLSRKASKRAKKKRVHEEMSKYKRGSLRSSSGQKVTNRKQAIAIALSEAGQSKKIKRGKRHSKKSRKHGKKKRTLKR